MSNIVGTTTSAPSAAAVQAQAQAVTADLFSTWPLPSQVAYLQSRGGGSPPALLMPTAAGGQALVSIAPGSNLVEITATPDGFSTGLQAPSPAGALTLAQFQALPSDAERAAYLAARPDEVDAKTFDDWSPDRQTAYLALEVDAVTLAQFQSWPAQFQAYYLANKGAGSPPSLVLAGDGASVAASLSGDGASVQFAETPALAAVNSYLTKYATSIYPLYFFSMTADEQAKYISTRLTAKGKDFANQAAANVQQHGVPLPMPTGADALDVVDLTGSSSDSTILTISVAGQAVKIALPSAKGPGNPVDYSAVAAGTADGTAFASWPPQVQSAYVLQQSAKAVPAVPAATYPKVAVLSDFTVAIIASSGAPASVVTDPAGSAVPPPVPTPVTFEQAYGGAAPAPTDFLRWPYACQLAWLRKQTASPVTLGTNPNGLQVALNADGSGFRVAVAADLGAFLSQNGASTPLTDDQRAKLVAGIDFPLFSKVAPPLLQAQLLAALADPGSSPPVVTVTSNIDPNLKLPAVISGGTAATGGGYTIEPLPNDYGTPPAALTPAAFMAWSPAVRESYVLSRVKAPLPGSVIAGATSNAPSTVVPPFYVGSGADAVAVDFSQVDGTLQVTLPGSLGDIVTSGTGGSAAATPLAGTGAQLPYYNLPGAVGTTSPINDAVSAALYPLLDGSGGAHDIAMTPQQQLDYAKAPSALSGSTFASWPTALELQYLRQYQSPGTPLTIGTGTDSIDVLMQTTAAAGTVPKVYIVQNLQKADIGQMSYADQATLAKSRAFTAIAAGLGLIPDDGTVAALGGRDVPDPNAGLTTATPVTSGTPALSAFGYVQTMFTTALNTINSPTLVAPTALPDGNMPAADRKVFEDEVNLLRQQTFGSPLPTSQQNQSGGQAIFSPKDIQDKLTAIIQRFTRANAFSSIANAPATAGSFQIVGYTGTESGKTEYVYNPNLSGTGDVSDQDLWDNLGYYEFDTNEYRTSDDKDGKSLGSAIGAALNTVSPALVVGVPTTIQNLAIKITTTNTHDTNSSGAHPAGDSEVVNTLTVQKVDPGSVPSDSKNLAAGSVDRFGYYHAGDGSWYEIINVTGSTINASSNTAAPFSATSRNTAAGTNVYSLGSFQSTYGITDNGQSIIGAIPNDPTLKDGNPHTISVPSLQLTGGGYTFSVSQVIVRYLPAAASTDDNKTIDSGYQTFMAQEKSILDLANRANQLVTSGKIGGTQQNLDVPSLVYLFMMYTNLTGEAVLRADTEEVNQTNAVLNEYAIMQKIINQTVAAIKPGDDGKPGYGTLKGSNPDGSFTAQDEGALAMFTRGQTVGTGSAAAKNPPLSPIELLQNGFTRPYLSNGLGTNVASSQWSSDGTSLSDAVTQLNQVSQLKMNDINSETKQKDREFDLANTALQKMSDIVNKIAATI